MIKTLGLTKYYYSGDASRPSKQTEIKGNFKALLNEPYSRVMACKNNACLDSNIEILYDNETGKSRATLTHFDVTSKLKVSN